MPQGSILGPLLFLVYFNDLPDNLNSDVDSYADDTTVTIAGNTLSEIENKLTLDGRKLGEWMKSNKLKLNTDKTHIMTIGTQQRLSSLTERLQVRLDDRQLLHDPSGSESLLGCKMDACLKWNHQVESLLSKLSRRISAISYLRYICPFHVKRTISEGMFSSVLIYCLPLFAGLEKGQLNKLQIMQNKAARLVCNAAPRAKRTDLYNKVGWLTVNQLAAYHSILQVFKIRQAREPLYLAEIFCKESRSGRIMIPRNNLSLAADSFCFRGSNLWNQLPRNLRNVKKIGTFKRDVKKWVTENVPQFLD